MSGFSTYLSSEILNWVKGTTFDAAPAAVYVSLHTADPGLTGANEATTTIAAARVAVTFGSITLKKISNSAAIDFGTALNTATITHFGLWDAATSGNFLGGDALEVTRAIVADDPVSFLIGDFSIQL